MDWNFEGTVFSNNTMRSPEFSTEYSKEGSTSYRSTALTKLLDPRRELRRIRMEAEDVDFEEVEDSPEPPKSAVSEGEKP